MKSRRYINGKPITKAGRPFTKSQLVRAVSSSMTEDEMVSMVLAPDFVALRDRSYEDLVAMLRGRS